MLTPGSTLDMEGYVRIGYANHPDVLHQGLQRLGDFSRNECPASTVPA